MCRTMPSSSSPPNTQIPDEICHDCLKYDLHTVIPTARSGILQCDSSDGFMLANVGKRYTTPFETNCSLCRILLAWRKASLDLYPIQNEDESDTDELRLFSLSLDAKIGVSDARHPAFFDLSFMTHMPLYLGLTSSKFPFDVQQRCAIGAKQGFVVLRNAYEPLGRITAQLVSPSFDPVLTKKLIQDCRDRHGSICSVQDNVSVTNLNLIDCESLVVEKGQPQAPYVALSYVWGSSTACDQYCLEATSGSTFSLPSILPLVISDAISVTKSLGFRYLWVDKFCIDQANHDMKRQQIVQMGSVYENAELTIIAAADFDETHGLPGVGSKLRSIQPIARIKDLTVVSTMRHIHNSIRSSKWYTRGWTFQEAMLSRRRLVFTDEQTYFECNGLNYCESFSETICASSEGFRYKLSSYPRDGMWERLGWHIPTRPERGVDNLERYLNAVEDYTSRELRYQQDSLNAFAGVIKKFERARVPIIQLWGVPIFTDQWGQTDFRLVHALSWNHAYSCWDGPLRPYRRPEFPSWSWAGWAGKVNCKIDYVSKYPLSPRFQFKRHLWRCFYPMKYLSNLTLGRSWT
jgi:hypothetical protein